MGKKKVLITVLQLSGCSLLFSAQAYSFGPAARTPSHPNPNKLTDSEYWRQTGITLKSLESNINDEVCLSSEQKFIGCVNALNYLISYAHPQRSLLPASTARGSKIIQSFGPLVVAEETKSAVPAPSSEKEAESSFEIWKRGKAQLEVESQAKAEIFQLTRNSRSQISFDEILDELWETTLSSPSVKKEDLSFVIASTINVYLNSAIDPHTRIEPYQQYLDDLNITVEQYGGIGTTLERRNGAFRILTPFEEGGALKAGLRYGDVITHVDGVSTENMRMDTLVASLKGPQGTLVQVRILRKGNPFEVSITRAMVVRKNFTARMLDDSRARMGYLRLLSFENKESCAKMEEEIKALESQGAQGLILDLRGNRGGSLEQAICIGGLFFGNKVSVKVKDLSDENSDFLERKSKRATPLTHLPMVTLIDGDSASASELVSGALQDYQRSWITGDRSYGKGTVQRPTPLNPWIYYWGTIQRFHQPSGRTNQLVGIIPDFPTLPFPGATEEDQFTLREADLFTNAVPQTGPAWEQTRPESLAKMKACLSETAKADQRYQELQDGAVAPDYRLLSAEDILYCDLSL